LRIAAITLGFGGILVGVFLVGGYLYAAVFARWGESDQSLLFWYLPFLMAGIGSLGVGIGAVTWGRR
jgi:hypothetical protein